jgi:hypothetical protein
MFEPGTAIAENYPIVTPDFCSERTNHQVAAILLLSTINYPNQVHTQGSKFCYFVVCVLAGVRSSCVQEHKMATLDYMLVSTCR